MNCLQQASHTIRQGDNLYHLARHYHTTVPMILAMNPGLDPYDLEVGTMLLICPGDDFVPPGGFVYPYPRGQIALLGAMRMVWAQHVYWTRMLLISTRERLGDKDAVTARLMQNPGDIAGLFAQYYSADTAGIIEQLLTEHLQIGAELITALRDKKATEADALNRRWYINADKMAEALSMINPYFPREELRKMLYDHLDLTAREVMRRLGGDYPADIAAFDEVEREAMAMADYFSYGIIRQFPQKFM